MYCQTVRKVVFDHWVIHFLKLDEIVLDDAFFVLLVQQLHLLLLIMRYLHYCLIQIVLIQEPRLLLASQSSKRQCWLHICLLCLNDFVVRVFSEDWMRPHHERWTYQRLPMRKITQHIVICHNTVSQINLLHVSLALCCQFRALDLFILEVDASAISL